MGIFGKMDAENIKTNPFFIEKGVYSAEVVAGKYQESKDGAKQIYIQYEITEEDSAFLGNKANKIYTLPDPEMTQEAFNMLPNDEQKKIRQNMGNIKRDFCGSDGNTSKKGLGIPVEDLNDENWNPEVTVGLKVTIGIANYGADGVDVRWVNLRDE